MNENLTELLGYFKMEARITEQLFAHLNDASLAQRVTEKDRSLGEMAWHLVTSIPEMLGYLGLHVPGPAPDAPPPASAQELLEAYRQVSQAALTAMAHSWTDASLGEVHEVYGYRWSKAQTVWALLFHQTHHRGAMTVLMRQAGLKLPDIYGPSRDSQENHG
ncbi:MAG: DinB family protein [Thermoanaerobaculum sp.]